MQEDAGREAAKLEQVEVQMVALGDLCRFDDVEADQQTDWQVQDKQRKQDASRRASTDALCAANDSAAARVEQNPLWYPNFVVLHCFLTN